MRWIPVVLVLVLALAGCTPVPPSGDSNPQYLQTADDGFLRGEFSQAAGHYEAFLASNPSHPKRAEILVKAGKCQLGAERPDPAIRLFDEALALLQGGAVRWDAAFRRGVALRMKGETARALEAFRSAASAPAAERGSAVTDDELHYETAVAHFRGGDWKQGQAALTLVRDGGAYRERKAACQGLVAFTVQVGSYAQESHARAQESKLKFHVPSAAVRPVAGADPRFLVSAGSFARYDDARREADRLRSLGFTDAFVIP